MNQVLLGSHVMWRRSYLGGYHNILERFGRIMQHMGRAGYVFMFVVASILPNVFLQVHISSAAAA